MKLNIIYSVFVLALIGFIFQSSSQGRANAADSGNTGAPGDQATTCITCHGTSAGIQVEMIIEATDSLGTIITEYEPDSTYTLTVTLNATTGTPTAYGFQMVCLDAPLDQDGDDVPSWSNPSDNAKIVTISSGRTYVEHDGPSSMEEFTTQWKAPGEGSEEVTFYACGNGVNLNGETSGDNAACNTLVLSEKIISSTSKLNKQLDISLGPNPANDFIQLFSDFSTSEEYTIQFYSLTGQLIKSQVRHLPAGEQSTYINIENLDKGTYLIRGTNNNRAFSLKFVKL